MLKHFLCWPLLFGVAILLSPIFELHSESRAATLVEFFAAADSTSPRLLEAKLEVARTRAFFGEQRAVPNPTLFGSSEELGNDDTSVQERTIGVKQEFGFLWTMGAQRTSAAAALAAADARYQADRNEVHTDLILQLLRLQQLKTSLQLSDTLEQHYTGILLANEAREREGDISGYNAQRVRLESVAVSNRRAELQAEWQELARQLRRDTGMVESALLSIDVESMSVLDLPSKEAALDFAELHSPDLRFLQADEKAKVKNVKANKLKRLPNLSVGVGQKSTDRDESGLLLEAELELPFFNRRTTAVQLARAEQYSATRRLTNAQLQLPDIVGRAYDRWQSFQQQNDTTPTLEELATHVNAAQLLYLNGETGYLELLDAIQSSEEILSASHELALARLQADLRLRQLTGNPILEDQ